MKFTIIFDKNLSDDKRLKKDGSFGEIDDINKLYEDDKLFNTWEEAKSWLVENPYAVIDGVDYETDPVSHMLGTPSFDIRPHRISKPKKFYPLKQEIYNLLRNANDDVYNMLVIDFEGNSKLIQKPGFSYAVRLEGFGAGNGYVGIDSKMNHFETTYLTLLEGWLTHLESTGISIYQDYCSHRKSEQELIDGILEEIDKI